MSDLRFPFPACLVAESGKITPEDVTQIRGHMWPAGIRTRQQATMAIALDLSCHSCCPEWTSYLVEEVSNFIVWHEPSDGAVSGEAAGWLLEQLSEHGTIYSQAGLDIVLRVLDLAGDVPSFLSATALNQVRLALLPEPRGAYAIRRCGDDTVTRSDLAFIWRVLRSSVERGCLNLSNSEKLILQNIDLHAAPRDNQCGWRELMALTQLACQSGQARTTAWLDIKKSRSSSSPHAA